MSRVRSKATPARVAVTALALVVASGCSDQTLLPALDPAAEPSLSATDGLFPVVTVSATAPASAAGALTNNLADAMERVTPGGKILVRAGTYLVNGLAIRKPVTIEAASPTRPVFDAAGAGHNLVVADMVSGPVVIRGVRFENVSGPGSNVHVSGAYASVLVDDAEFLVPGASTPSGSLGYGSGLFAFQARGEGITIQNSSFMGGDIGVHTNDASGVVILNSTFVNQSNAAIHGGGLRAEGNTIRGCGRNWCVMGGGSLELIGNTIEVQADRPVVNAVQVHGASLRIEGNVITGTGGTRLADAATWPIQGNGIAVAGTATVSGNRISGAHNGLGFGNGVVTGSDNVVMEVGSVLNIYQATVTLHSSDFTAYARPFQFVHEPGSSSLTCNWWGSASGPQHIDPWTDPALYTPWATEPIAGTGRPCGA